VSPSVEIGPEPYDSPVGRKLVADLDADLDDRYADVDLESEPDWAMLNLLGESVSPPLGAFLVARIDGVPVGCGALRPLPGEEQIAEVKRMYVAPATRGGGIARALLAALEVEARRLGYARVVLETGTRQAEAMALYESAGYTPIPNFGAYRASSWSRCYEKALDPGTAQ
jgi:GNAT superfamily N-acetyltransferase